MEDRGEAREIWDEREWEGRDEGKRRGTEGERMDRRRRNGWGVMRRSEDNGERGGMMLGTPSTSPFPASAA